MAVKMVTSKFILEMTIEAELIRRCLDLGGVCEKVTVPGRRGFFDRLVVLPGNWVAFVEVKRPHGGTVAAHQSEYAKRYAGLGARVAIIKNVEQIDELLRDYPLPEKRKPGARESDPANPNPLDPQDRKELSCD